MRSKSRHLRTVCSLTIVSGLLSMAAAPAIDELGIFELEGNALDDAGVPGDDWDTVNLGSGGASVAATGVLSDPAPNTIFVVGGSKDISDITQWSHKSGSVPDKDNITNAYAAAYNVNGDLVIYFGADRFANDGSAQLGFWFFQENVTLNPNGSFNGTHLVGDVLVLANFEQGGSVPVIQVMEWVGTGGDQKQGTLRLLLEAANAECGPALGDHNVCAITNRAPTPSPWPYTPKSGASDIFPAVSFFEGGINITKVFQNRGAVPCFASFLAETRSSTSVTAQLKDFVLGAFPVCGIDIVKSCTEGTINPTATGFIYTFSGTVTNTGIGTLFDVTVVDDVGTPGDPSDDLTFNMGSLAGGASKSFGDTFESTQNPPTNRASVTAATRSGGPVTVSDQSNPAVCPRVDRSPLIDVTKVCEVRLVARDDLVVVEVSFSGQVCNTGNVRLDSVTVTDDAGTPGDPSDDLVISIGTLQVNECKPYSGTYLPRSVNSEVPGLASFSGTVTAKGVAPLGFGPPEDTATATCPVCPPSS